MAGLTAAEQYLTGYARILRDACATGRRLSRSELDARRSQGERAAEEGAGLRELVRAHLAEAQAVQITLAASAAWQLLAAVEQAVDAFVEGFERAQRLAVRQEEAARREFIDVANKAAERAGCAGDRPMTPPDTLAAVPVSREVTDGRVCGVEGLAFPGLGGANGKARETVQDRTDATWACEVTGHATYAVTQPWCRSCRWRRP